MTFYAYVYRDPSRNNEPIYVGKGKGRRARRHLARADMHPFVHRLKFMKRAGVEPHIEVIEALDEGHAFFLETCLIEMFGRKDLKTGSLLNLTDGGEGASGSVLGPQSPEHRAKISAAHTGVKLGAQSTEHRAKLSAAGKGKKRPPFSPEARANMSAAQKGKKPSPESRAKMSASQKRREPASLETRAKISAAKFLYWSNRKEGGRI